MIFVTKTPSRYETATFVEGDAYLAISNYHTGPREAAWNVRLIELGPGLVGGRADYSDFPTLGTDTLLVRERAYQALEPMLATHCVPLEVRTADGQVLYALHVTRVLDALVPERSDFYRLPGLDTVLDITKPWFRDDVLGDMPIFRVPLSCSPVYVNERFRDAVVEHGFVGLDFIPVWPPEAVKTEARRARRGARKPRQRRMGRAMDRLDRIISEIQALERDALYLGPSKAARAGATSWFGGRPMAGDSFEWPVWQGRPLAFLGQLDMRSASQTMGTLWPDWLPSTGSLAFFFDAEECPWGYDPAHAGSLRVIPIEPGAASSARTAPLPARLPRPASFPKRSVEFVRGRSFPSEDRIADAAALTREEFEKLSAWRLAQLEGMPALHQLLGYPFVMQADDMELQCQLVTHGISCGDSAGYEDPRVPELSKGSADWKLLLQLSSDEDLEFAWGDGGMLYIWIREADARAGRFDRAWAIVQSM